MKGLLVQAAVVFESQFDPVNVEPTSFFRFNVKSAFEPPQEFIGVDLFDGGNESRYGTEITGDSEVCQE